MRSLFFLFLTAASFIGLENSAAQLLSPTVSEHGGKQKLSLTIVLQNRRVAPGDSLTVKINIKNVSSSPVEFTYFKPHFWIPRMVDRKTGEGLPFNAELVTETIIPVEKIHRVLAAGESISEQSYPLHIFDKPSRENLTYIVCKPGEYKVQIDLRLVKDSPKDREGVLTSNQIPVEVVAASSVGQEKPKLVGAPDIWEKFFFAEIDKTSRFGGLRGLRSLVLPKDDLEIRVWVGFGLSRVRSFIVRRKAGESSAASLRSYVPKPPMKIYQNLKPPKSGWKSFWKQIVDEGVLTLPDSSELKNEKLIDDGTSFVVETNADGIYRTYHYNSPDYQEWQSARQMIKISNIIADEFDLSDFKFEPPKL